MRNRSMRLSQTARLSLVLGTGAWLAASGLAQQPDLLDQTKRTQSIAIQQFEAETRLALSDAVRTSTSDRAKAIEQYRQILKKVESDAVLPAERRETLVRVIKDRIRVTEASAVIAEQEAASKKAIDARAKAQAEAEAKAAEDSLKIKDALKSVADLRKEGKTAEASKVAKNLLAEYPNNLAVQMLNGVSSVFASAQEFQAIQAETEQKRVALALEVDRAAVPASGDVEFPKDWKEKSAKRLKPTLSPTEMKLLKALNSPVQTEFKASRLQDAVDTLSQLSGTTIFLDKALLDEAGTSYDTPVTFNTRSPVQMRSILRSVLSQANLTYVVREGMIQVTTPQRAKDTMVTKAYYVGDLLGNSGVPFANLPPGGFNDPAQMNLQISMIMEMITSSIDPLSWNGKGGSGSIGFNVPTMSLIIRQSAEVHAMIRGSISR